MTRLIRRLRRGAKRAGNALLGALAVGVLKSHTVDRPRQDGQFRGWAMRKIGPLFKENRIGATT